MKRWDLAVDLPQTKTKQNKKNVGNVFFMEKEWHNYLTNHLTHTLQAHAHLRVQCAFKFSYNENTPKKAINFSPTCKKKNIVLLHEIFKAYPETADIPLQAGGASPVSPEAAAGGVPADSPPLLQGHPCVRPALL